MLSTISWVLNYPSFRVSYPAIERKEKFLLPFGSIFLAKPSTTLCFRKNYGWTFREYLIRSCSWNSPDRFHEGCSRRFQLRRIMHRYPRKIGFWGTRLYADELVYYTVQWRAQLLIRFNTFFLPTLINTIRTTQCGLYMYRRSVLGDFNWTLRRFYLLPYALRCSCKSLQPP